MTLNKLLPIIALILPMWGNAMENEQLKNQVIEREKAFAKTIVDRDFAAFGTFVSEEAIFYSGPTPLIGKERVLDNWSYFYKSKTAPFTWSPSKVEVLESGKLAISSGPVLDEMGQCILEYTSIWRLESDNEWRVIFDKGNQSCL